MQVKSGTIFDNVLICDDEEYAAKFGEETWGATKDPEKEMKDAVSNRFLTPCTRYHCVLNVDGVCMYLYCEMV